MPSSSTPGYAPFFAKRALAYLLRARGGDALADFSRAIELDSVGAVAYICRGMVYEGMGRAENAAADYSRATELDPGLSDMLAYVLAFMRGELAAGS